MTWIDIREPHTGWLLFRYDPNRGLVEVQRRGIVTIVDLNQYKQDAKPEHVVPQSK